ncbi:MAG: hypothetical protein PXX77_09625 [Gallionella sp.]|nr:hypothetical protein [Gallionella sp.]
MTLEHYLPEDLPVLTEVVGESSGEFPTLTEVVEETPAPISTDPGDTTVITSSRVDSIAEPKESAEIVLETSVGASLLAKDDRQQADSYNENDLLAQVQLDLEAHLEKVFAQKLQQHLADAQQQAIAQTLAELKDALPELIRKALASPQDPS